MILEYWRYTPFSPYLTNQDIEVILMSSLKELQTIPPNSINATAWQSQLASINGRILRVTVELVDSGDITEELDEHTKNRDLLEEEK